MTLPDFRMAIGLTAAGRATRNFPKPKPSNPAARRGLQYENRVGKQLQQHIHSELFRRIEHNPWFTFSDTYGTSNCCPDFLLWCDSGIIIVEVKLTWVEVAIAKLTDLYCPVISHALQEPVTPLIICRNVTANSPTPKFTISSAMVSPYRLLHWPDTGKIQWS